VNTAETLPEAIVTETGTASAGLLSEIATTVFAFAALERETVQIEDAPGPIEPGLQATELSVGAALTMVWIKPLTAFMTGNRVPPVAADVTPVIEIGREESNDDRDGTAVTTATMPLPIVVLFIPHAIQRTRPASERQEIFLFAAVAAAPGATVTEVKSAD
jgi:hypothetical protein